MLIQAYGEDYMHRTQVFEWYKRFIESRQEVEDDESSGWLVSSRIEENAKFTGGSRIYKQFLTEKHIATLENLPYFTDLFFLDFSQHFREFFFSPKIKSVQKETRFESLEAVKKTTSQLYSY